MTSHNYDDETAEEIYEAIVNTYHPLFMAFEEKMARLSRIEPKLF